jgi:hypothetical protein
MARLFSKREFFWAIALLFLIALWIEVLSR